QRPTPLAPYHRPDLRTVPAHVDFLRLPLDRRRKPVRPQRRAIPRAAQARLRAADFASGAACERHRRALPVWFCFQRHRRDPGVEKIASTVRLPANIPPIVLRNSMVPRGFSLPRWQSTTASPSITKRLIRFRLAASTIQGKRLVQSYPPSVISRLRSP